MYDLIAKKGNKEITLFKVKLCNFICISITFSKSAGITDAIRLGTKELPPIDPFHHIDSLIFEAEESNQLQSICNLTIE